MLCVYAEGNRQLRHCEEKKMRKICMLFTLSRVVPLKGNGPSRLNDNMSIFSLFVAC